MKRVLNIMAIATVLSCATSQAGLVLTQGESFTYEFTSLPLLFSYPPSQGDPPGDYFCAVLPQAGFRFASYSSDISARFEFFGDSVQQLPFYSGVFTGDHGLPIAIATTDNGWSDLTGVLRLTALEGSLDLEWFRVAVAKTKQQHPLVCGFYSQEVNLVPEPKACLIMAVSALTLLSFGGFRRSRS
jgi:hypothetical protein